MMFSRDLYNECFDDQSYLVKATAKDQYTKAWHLYRYAKFKRSKMSAKLIESLYFHLCAEDGISWHIVKAVWLNAYLNNLPKFPNYWQKCRARIAQSREQISAADVLSASYPI